MNIWFYDIEVYKYDWHISFINYTTKEVVHVTNDRDRLENFINLIKDDSILMSFNGKHYDDNILKGLLIGIDPKTLNDWIIVEGKKPFNFPGFRKAYSLKLFVYDLKNSAVNRDNMGLALKEYEGYIGSDIRETEIGFDIDRPLTPEELQREIDYCDNDVYETIKMFETKQQQERFEARLDLIQMFELDLQKSLNQTDANLVAQILDAQKVSFDDGHIFEMPSEVQVSDTEVVDFFTKQPLTDKMKLVKEIDGIKYIFGIGGLHAAKPKYVYNPESGNRLTLFDIESHYPSMVIQYGLHSRATPNVDKYKQIYEQRFIWKKQKDPRQAVLKLILNTYYGTLDAKFNPMYDQKNRRAIAILGQLTLLDLIEKISPYCEVIQANTDGVLVEQHDEEKIKEAIKEWEDRTRLKMGEEEYVRMYQRDVNNYFGVMEDGKVKAKGTAVKYWAGGSPFNWNYVIIAKAIGAYLKDNTPIEETIKNVIDIRDYQRVYKKTGKYDGACTYVNDELIELQRVNRIFATRDKNRSEIFKYKIIDGEKRDSKFSNTPPHAYVYNGELTEETKNIVDLDFEFYINLANKTLKGFINDKKD